MFNSCEDDAFTLKKGERKKIRSVTLSNEHCFRAKHTNIFKQKILFLTGKLHFKYLTMLRKIIYFNILILLYKICALSIKNWEKLTLNFDFICMSFCTSPEIHFKAGGAPPEKRFHHHGSSLKHHSKVNLAFLQHCIKKHVTASSKNTLITIIKFITRNTKRKLPNLFFFSSQ